MLERVREAEVRYRVREYVAESTERLVVVTADEYRRLVKQLMNSIEGRKQTRLLVQEWCLSTAVEAAKLWPLSLAVIVLCSVGRMTGWFSEGALVGLASNGEALSQILRFGSIASVPVAVILSWSLHSYKDDFSRMIDDLLNLRPQLLDGSLPVHKILVIRRD